MDLILDNLHIIIPTALIPLFVKYFLSLLERNKRTRGFSTWGMVVILGDEHYKYLKSILLLNLTVSSILYFRYRDLGWLYITFLLVVYLLFALYKLKRIAWIPAILVMFLTSFGINDPSSPLKLPIIQNLFEKSYQSDSLLSIAPFLLTLAALIFHFGLYEKPSDLAKSHQLTKLQQQKVRQKIKKYSTRGM